MGPDPKSSERLAVYVRKTLLKRNNPKLHLPFESAGASRGTRTPDLVLTKDLLYQLSY